MLPLSHHLASRKASTVVAAFALGGNKQDKKRPLLSLRSRSATTVFDRRIGPIAIDASASPRSSSSSVVSLRCGSTIMASAASASSAPAPSAAAAGAVKDKTPFIIVGSGRVGEALAEMGEKDLLVRRNDPIPAADDATYPLGTPIVVCTRNDALDSVLAATPRERQKDLVFIQNGMIQPWLARNGLDDAGDGDAAAAAATQVLVFFAVSAKGQKPIDGVTDTDPGGLTCAHGRHARAFAERLNKCGGLSCRVVAERADFDAAALEKLVWISAFMLVGARHGGGVTVGDVEAKHTREVSELIEELYRGGAEALGLKKAEGKAEEEGNVAAVVERLRAYARSVAHFPTAVKEFEWRNGWFWGLSQRAAEGEEEDPFPTHSRLLKEVGAV